MPEPVRTTVPPAPITGIVPTVAEVRAALQRPSIPVVLPPYDSPAASHEDVLDVLGRWHDEVHSGPRRFCYERPCREINGVIRGPVL